MSNEALLDVLTQLRARYKQARRREKWRILTEFCLSFDYSRKHAIRLLNGKVEIRKNRSGPKRKYDEDLLPVVKWLWFRMGQPCSRRLKFGIRVWLPHYRKRFPAFTDEQAALITQASRATLDRYLSKVRIEKGLSGTRKPRSSWYKSVIPIQAKDWSVTAPGTLQGDTVAHCGDSLDGAFVNSLTLTDIHTSWPENRATWGKSGARVKEAIQDIEKTIPFVIRTIKFDSGTEFMNYDLITYLRSYGPNLREKPIEIVRSRPYRKNDNCYVEQKNFTHVRALIGYDRLDSRVLVENLNRIYKQFWNPLQNFFMPSMKLKRKERIGARIKKYYDEPKTPYERIIESESISKEQKEKLKLQFLALDPIELQEGLEKELKLFYETLKNWKESLKIAA